MLKFIFLSSFILYPCHVCCFYSLLGLISNTGCLQGPKGPEALSREEENRLETYVLYMASTGVPLSRDEVKAFANAIDKKFHDPQYFGKSGPSNGWCDNFFKRHPSLALRIPGKIDGGRAAMGHESVVRNFIELCKETFEKHGVIDHPERIINIDETGVGGSKDGGVQRKFIFQKGCKFPLQRTTPSYPHITVALAIQGNGDLLPPLVIFANGLPRNGGYEEIGPADAVYFGSDSGFIDTSIYMKYLQHLDQHLADVGRPLVILQDNLKSHLSMEVVEFCLTRDIVLINFPAKTTHMLQPVDRLTKTFKDYINLYARQAGLLRVNQTISKAQFPAVLKQTLTKITPEVVKGAFRGTGIVPLNPGAISSEKFVADTMTPAAEKQAKNHIHNASMNLEVYDEDGDVIDVCSDGSSNKLPHHVILLQTLDEEAAVPTDEPTPVALVIRLAPEQQIQKSVELVSAAVQTEPEGRHCTLVEEGIIPREYADVFWFPPNAPKKPSNKSKRNTAGLVLTDPENVAKMREAAEEKKRQEEEKKKKQEAREKEKLEKKKAAEQTKKKKVPTATLR